MPARNHLSNKDQQRRPQTIILRRRLIFSLPTFSQRMCSTCSLWQWSNIVNICGSRLEPNGGPSTSSTARAGSSWDRPPSRQLLPKSPLHRAPKNVPPWVATVPVQDTPAQAPARVDTTPRRRGCPRHIDRSRASFRPIFPAPNPRRTLARWRTSRGTRRRGPAMSEGGRESGWLGGEGRAGFLRLRGRGEHL